MYGHFLPTLFNAVSKYKWIIRELGWIVPTEPGITLLYKSALSYRNLSLSLAQSKFHKFLLIKPWSFICNVVFLPDEHVLREEGIEGFMLFFINFARRTFG